MSYSIIAFGLSDTGLVRHNNEDAWADVPEISFYTLADGMGGHNAGEIASQMAVRAVCEHFQQTVQIAGDHMSIEEAHGLMRLAIEYANDVVFSLNRSNEDWRGMGTTLCCIYCHPKGIVYAHVGDSRIYKYHQGKIQQITKDHSLLRQLLDAGKIKPDQASAYKNIITKAIGTEKNVEPSIDVSLIEEETLYLMCSDGLSDMLGEEEIATILNMHKDPKIAARALIEEANNKGGSDNITVVLVKIGSKNK